MGCQKLASGISGKTINSITAMVSQFSPMGYPYDPTHCQYHWRSYRTPTCFSRRWPHRSQTAPQYLKYNKFLIKRIFVATSGKSMYYFG